MWRRDADADAKNRVPTAQIINELPTRIRRGYAIFQVNGMRMHGNRVGAN